MPKTIDRDTFPELRTGAESRRLVGISTAVWLELLETDRLPKPVRVESRFKWRKADLLRWVDAMQPMRMLG